MMRLAGILRSVFACGYAFSGVVSGRPSGTVGPWSPRQTLLGRLEALRSRPHIPQDESDKLALSRAAEKRERRRQKHLKEAR